MVLAENCVHIHGEPLCFEYLALPAVTCRASLQAWSRPPCSGGGTAAVAAIPSTSSGVITGCVNKKTAILRVIDYQAGKRCTRKEKQVAWNQKGTKGAMGPAGAKGDTGPTGATGTAGAKGDTGPSGAAGPTGPAGAAGAVTMQGIVSKRFPADRQWHDVARVTLKPGTWDVDYSSYTTSTGLGYDPSSTIAGGISCKITVGGVVTLLADSSNGQYGQYTMEPSKTTAVRTDVVWTCVNTVTKNGAPFDLDMEFYVAQRTPPVTLDSAAL